MDSIPSISGLRSVGGVFFFLFISLFGWLPFEGAFSRAAAADKVTFSWRANPLEDNVIGYRLYAGPSSRFVSAGVTKSNFSYGFYIDFADSQRCQLTASGPVCETYTSDEVSCVGLYGETPKCTLNNLEGRYYFAMTAYNAQAESDYTGELSGYFTKSGQASASPQVIGAMKQAYLLLLN